VDLAVVCITYDALKGNCSKKILLQNIFGFHVYITNIYVKLSTETVIMPKATLKNLELEKLGTSYEEVPPEAYFFVAGSRPH